jgi:hypothetical protein
MSKFWELIGIQSDPFAALVLKTNRLHGSAPPIIQPFALRVATQFGLESNPASGVCPTRPLRPNHALSSFLKSGVREGAKQRMMPPMQFHEAGLPGVGITSEWATIHPLATVNTTPSGTDLYHQMSATGVFHPGDPSTIHAGAWSLAFSSPRTHRSMPPSTSRSHTLGERRR